MFIKKLTAAITAQDQFSFSPESNFLFNKKPKFSTFPGGLMSITLTIVFTFTWYNQLYLMINYLANNISTFTTVADLEKIGTVNLKEMKSVPFYGFYYKN